MPAGAFDQDNTYGDADRCPMATPSARKATFVMLPSTSRASASITMLAGVAKMESAAGRRSLT